MEMITNAGILSKDKKGRSNCYKVINMPILEYVAMREKNSLLFLSIYIEKVLKDSGIYDVFNNFFDLQTKESFKKVKVEFSNFTIRYTKIKGKTECNRIFSKVINSLSYFKNSRGTIRGHLSQDIITYDILMYNRNNFRDMYADKPKRVTRKEYALENPIEVNDAYYKYQSVKAKKFLRKFNDNYRKEQSEHIEERHMEDKVTNIHHIFPEAEYKEISAYIENLIVLTPTQHFNFAHPNGNTQEIDEQYQHLLLLSKADRIYENLISDKIEHIYDFDNFLFVLEVGVECEEKFEIQDMDFNSVVNVINIHYAS